MMEEEKIEKNALKEAKYYEIEGVKYPAVTTILNVIAKPQLIEWFKRQLYENIKIESEKATDIGHLIHEIVKKLLKGEKVEFETQYPDEVRNCVSAFFKWKEKNKFEVICNELLVFSKKYHFAGTTDCIIKDNLAMSLLDFKTAKAIYPEYLLQVAAYKTAFEEMTQKKLKNCYIVRFGKLDGEFEVQKVNNIKKLFQVFLSAKKIYEWQKEVEKNG